MAGLLKYSLYFSMSVVSRRNLHLSTWGNPKFTISITFLSFLNLYRYQPQLNRSYRPSFNDVDVVIFNMISDHVRQYRSRKEQTEKASDSKFEQKA